MQVNVIHCHVTNTRDLPEHHSSRATAHAQWRAGTERVSISSADAKRASHTLALGSIR